MVSRPVLNYDVLLGVAAASSWKDSAGLLDSCRSLHLEGPKMLLRQPVRLDTEAELLSFLAFLNRGLDNTRTKFVRDLHFGLGCMFTQTSSKLILALCQMSSLSSLSIDGSECFFDGCECFLDGRRRLLNAFAALTSIRTLRLPDAGQYTIQFLQSLQSKLVSIDIEFPGDLYEKGFFDESMTPKEHWPKYHPAVLLARSRFTLREIKSKHWYTHPEIMPDSELVYPEMRRLTMVRSSIPLTAALIRAYPNLAFLAINTHNPESGCVLNGRVQTTHRDKNLAAQGSPGCSWTKLDEFWGPLDDFYVLGLTCPVNRLALFALRSDHLYMLKPVLGYARPRDLYLRACPRGPNSPAEVFAALPGCGGSQLECLVLDYSLHGMDRDVHVAGLLEKLMIALEHSPLQALRITVRLPDIRYLDLEGRFDAMFDDEYDNEDDEDEDEDDEDEDDEEEDEEDEDEDEDDEDDADEDKDKDDEHEHEGENHEHEHEHAHEHEHEHEHEDEGEDDEEKSEGEADEGKDDEGEDDEGEDHNDSGIFILSPRRPVNHPLYLVERSAAQFDIVDYIRKFVTLVPTLSQATVWIEG